MKNSINLILLLVSFSLSAQQDADIFSLFTSRYVDIDGYRINIEVAGEGPAIFFFAGGSGKQKKKVKDEKTGNI